MLPAVSAEDCLVADLGVDPGERGWQSWEATGFLLHGFRPDPTAGLVLWQVDGIGKLDWNLDPDPRGLGALAEVLGELYPPEHELVFYRASLYAIVPGEAVRMALRGSPDRSPRRRRSTCRRCRADRSTRRWRANRRHAVVAVSSSSPRPLYGDDVPLRLVEPDAPLDALARLVGAASRSTRGRARAGRRPADRAGRSSRRSRAHPSRHARPRPVRPRPREAGAGEAVERLRPEVVVGRGRLDVRASSSASAANRGPARVSGEHAATEARLAHLAEAPSASYRPGALLGRRGVAREQLDRRRG